MNWNDLEHHVLDILKAAVAAMLVQVIILVASFLEAHIPGWFQVSAPVAAGVATIKITRSYS